MSTEGLPPTFPGSPPTPPPPPPQPAAERLVEPGDVPVHDYARARLQIGTASWPLAERARGYRR